jgi:hypothetical protein
MSTPTFSPSNASIADRLNRSVGTECRIYLNLLKQLVAEFERALPSAGAALVHVRRRRRLFTPTTTRHPVLCGIDIVILDEYGGLDVSLKANSGKRVDGAHSRVGCLLAGCGQFSRCIPARN